MTLKTLICKETTKVTNIYHSTHDVRKDGLYIVCKKCCRSTDPYWATLDMGDNPTESEREAARKALEEPCPK